MYRHLCTSIFVYLRVCACVRVRIAQLSLYKLVAGCPIRQSNSAAKKHDAYVHNGHYACFRAHAYTLPYTHRHTYTLIHTQIHITGVRRSTHQLHTGKKAARKGARPSSVSRNPKYVSVFCTVMYRDVCVFYVYASFFGSMCVAAKVRGSTNLEVKRSRWLRTTTGVGVIALFFV